MAGTQTACLMNEGVHPTCPPVYFPALTAQWAVWDRGIRAPHTPPQVAHSISSQWSVAKTGCLDPNPSSPPYWLCDLVQASWAWFYYL